jgi:hypothetical protein
MINFCTRYHIPSANGPLSFIIRIEVKKSIRKMTTFLLQILQKFVLKKICIFFRVLQAKSMLQPKLCGANVALTSKFHASTMLLLGIIDKQKCKVLGRLPMILL